eukprot:TRINITY_DN9001_c0_g1_i1.p1 TRINITY_DN9001_c0_g1~~TRINITY_DN9001_c0_g1_i1.p1  ORF type:complete len:4472 (-),score=913.68 TRINITY_DN9001_c0_g1_i1:1438-14763(-)
MTNLYISLILVVFTHFIVIEGGLPGCVRCGTKFNDGALVSTAWTAWTASNQDFTVAAWIKIDPRVDQGYVNYPISYRTTTNSIFAIGITANRTVTITAHSTSIGQNTATLFRQLTYSRGDWFHLAVWHDSANSRCSVWFNGVFWDYTSTLQSNSLENNAGILMLGNLQSSVGGVDATTAAQTAMYGGIDEVWLLQRALTPAEVTALAASRTSGAPDGLLVSSAVVAYYAMDECSSYYAQNSAPNAGSNPSSKLTFMVNREVTWECSSSYITSPTQCNRHGCYSAVTSYTTMPFADAMMYARSQLYDSEAGHLAVITHSVENAFIGQMLQVYDGTRGYYLGATYNGSGYVWYDSPESGKLMYSGSTCLQGFCGWKAAAPAFSEAQYYTIGVGQTSGATDSTAMKWDDVSEYDNAIVGLVIEWPNVKCFITGCYQLVIHATAMTRAAAVTEAAARTYRGRAGRLALITSALEQTNIWSVASAMLPDVSGVFVGGLATQGWDEIPGTYVTFCTLYCNWDTSEPDADGTSVVLKSNGKWMDTAASQFGYIVEYPNPPVCDSGIGGSGHCYEYHRGAGATYTAALAYTPLMKATGKNGYLATVTDLRERSLITQAIGESLGSTKVWLGGAYVPSVYRWQAGPEAGISFYSPGLSMAFLYASWAAGSPIASAGQAVSYTTEAGVLKMASSTNTNLQGFVIEYAPPVFISFSVMANANCRTRYSTQFVPGDPTQFPTRTGIVVRPGDRLIIYGDMLTSILPDGTTPIFPTGHSSTTVTIEGQTFRWGTLVAKISNGPWFDVTGSYDSAVVDYGGEVLLAVWDDFADDNWGGYNVVVMIYCADGQQDRVYCMAPPTRKVEVKAGLGSNGGSFPAKTGMRLLNTDYLTVAVPFFYAWDCCGAGNQYSSASGNALYDDGSFEAKCGRLVGQMATNPQYFDIGSYYEGPFCENCGYFSNELVLHSWTSSTAGTGHVLAYVWLVCGEQSAQRHYCNQVGLYPAVNYRDELWIASGSYNSGNYPLLGVNAQSLGIVVYPGDVMTISTDYSEPVFVPGALTRSGVRVAVGLFSSTVTVNQWISKRLYSKGCLRLHFLDADYENNYGSQRFAVSLRCSPDQPARPYCCCQASKYLDVTTSSQVKGLAAGGNYWFVNGDVMQISENNTWTSTAVLAPQAPSATTEFGTIGSVDKVHDWVIVGDQSQAHSSLTSPGSAYLFSRNWGGPADGFAYAKKLSATVPVANGLFGQAAALSLSYAFVGAPGASCSGSNSGGVYIFDRNSGGSIESYGFLALKCGSDTTTGHKFGRSVAVKYDLMVVGATGATGGVAGSGAVYAFAINQGGAANWGQINKISGLDAIAGDLFGQSVAYDGDYVLVGAPSHTPSSIITKTGAGAVYPFTREGTQFFQKTKMTAPDGYSGDAFGTSVAIATGGQIAISCGGNEQAVYIFDANWAGNNTFTFLSKVIPSSVSGGPYQTAILPLSNLAHMSSLYTTQPPCIADSVITISGIDRFGYNLDFSGDTMIVGHGGGVAGTQPWILRRNELGATNAWRPFKKLTDADGFTTCFGCTVAIDGNTILVGAKSYTDRGVSNAGAVFVYKRHYPVADNWGFTSILTSQTAATTAYLGHVLAVSGDYVVAASNINYGEIWQIDDVGTPTWIRTLVGTDTQSGDKFCLRIAIYGSYVACSSQRAAGNGNLALYVFRKNYLGANAWGQIQIKTSPGVPQLYGVMAMDDDVIMMSSVIGAGAGVVYVFQRNGANAVESWDYMLQISSPSQENSNDEFANCMSLHSGYAAITAHRANTVRTGEGAVYLFHRHRGGYNNWGLLTKYLNHRTTPSSNCAFVSLKWPIMALGCPDALSGAGSVSVASMGCLATGGAAGIGASIAQVRSVVPSRCSRLTGCGSITIYGMNIGDIVQAALGTKSLSSITRVDAHTVTAVMGTARVIGENTTLALTYSVYERGATLNNVVTLYDEPSPAIANIEPASAPRLGARSITMFGYNFNNSLGYPTSVNIAGAVATVNSISGNTAVLTLAAASAATTSPVINMTYSFNVYYPSASTFALNADPILSSVSDIAMPAAGGYVITIFGTGLGNGSDITLVQLLGVSAAIVSQTSTSVVVTVPSHAAATGNVQTSSLRFGDATMANGFTYNAVSTLNASSPDNGKTAGGKVITITSLTPLGNGTDVTSVTVGGVAAILGAQSTTTVTVTTGANSAGLVNVVVSSRSYGIATLTNGFRYNLTPTITSYTPTSAPRAGGVPITLTGTNFNNVNGYPTTITIAGVAVTAQTSQNPTELVVTLGAYPGATSGSAEFVYSGGDSYSIGTSLTLNVDGVITAAVPISGPFVGGTIVTITASNNIGNGSDITEVTLNGIAAVIQGQGTQTVTVQAGNGTLAIGTGDVIVISATRGTSTLVNGYRYNSGGAIQTIVPASGPLGGGTTITITAGTDISSGSDITSVTIGGVACSISAQTAQTVTVVVGDGTTIPGARTIVILSTSFGTISEPSGFTYNLAPVISGIVPLSGPQVGGITITLSGTNLGGNDITSVTIGGVAATITGQSSTRVTITSPARAPGTVNVLTQSTSFGNGTFSSFTYHPTPVFSSIVPANGPAAGLTIVTLTASNAFGSGSDVTAVTFDGVTATIQSQSASIITVQIAAHAAGAVNVVVSSTSRGTGSSVNGYTYNALPVLTGATPVVGPFVGGTVLTIAASNTIGNNDVTSVTLCGTAATITAQSANAVTVTTQTRNAAGTCTIQIVSTSYGTASLASAYTYNAVGVFSSASPSAGPLAGGTTVTIHGSSNIGSGADITSVTLGGIVVQSIVGQTASSVTVISAAVGSPASGGTVQSISVGTTTSSVIFQYLATSISAVLPSLSRFSGGILVTISSSAVIGTNDITAVTLAGIAATIQSQTSNSVTVLAGGSSSAVTGNVVVTSQLFGATTLVNGFTYNAAGIITSVVPSSGRISGGTVVTISGVGLGGNDIDTVSLGGVAVVISSQTTTSVTVTTNAFASAGVVTISINSNAAGASTLASGYTVLPRGTIAVVLPSSGPFAGDRYVTIFGSGLGSGSDITSVTLCGVTAVIVSQSANTVVVIQRPGVTAGLGDVVVSSFSRDSATRSNGFRYNVAGAVSTVSPSSTAISGGFTVTISGSSFGSGTDITAVFLAGQSVPILAQSSSVVIVQTVAVTAAASSAVLIQSTLFGNTSGSVFTYTPSIILTGPTRVTEGSAPVTLYVSLDCAPLTGVVIPVSVNALPAPYYAQARVSISNLGFVPSNYFVPQPIDVTAQDNYVAEGDVTCGVVFGPSSSGDPLFNGLVLVPTLTCVDNDVVGYRFSNGTLSNRRIQSTPVVLEGEQQTFGMTLTSEPITTVTIAATTLYVAQFFVSPTPTMLTFTPLNWNVTQNVTVRSIVDGIVGSLTFQYVNFPTPCCDPAYMAYGAVTTNNFALLLLDQDVNGHVIVLPPPNSRAETIEGGSPLILSAVLIKIILPGVTVSESLSVNDTNEATVSPSSLVMDLSMFLVPINIALSPVHDLIDDGDKPYTLTYVATTSDGIESTAAFDLKSINVDVAAINVSTSLLIVNETGSTASFSVWLTTLPTAPVTVLVTSSITSEVAIVSGASLTFTTSDYFTPQQVTVAGVRDNARDGNSTTTVLLQGAGSDAVYAARTASVSVVNLDIYWPRIPNPRFILPSVVPQLGTNASVVGLDFLFGMQVFVNGSATTNVTVLDYNTVLFQVPSTNYTNIYLSLYLLNPDGGFLLYSNALYYTDICPNVGEFGIGLECRSCPAGAYCPGGRRIWPSSGYWSPGEDSGFVVQCDSTDDGDLNRCLGYTGNGFGDSLCATGYAGWGCSSCATNYYVFGRSCRACDSPLYQVGLLFAQSAFLIIFMICTIFMDDLALNNVQFILLNFRVLWVVSLDAGEGVADWVIQTFSILRLLAGDLDFVHPGCSGIGTYAAEFGANIALMYGILIPQAIIIWIVYSIKMSSSSKAAVDDNAVLEIRSYFSRLRIMRMTRGALAIALYMYETNTVKTLSTLICVNAPDGRLYLLAHTNQECFVGEHYPSFIAAVILFGMVSLAMPFYLFKLVRTLTVQHHQSMNAVTLTLAENTIEEYKMEWKYYGLCSMVLVDLLLSLNTVVMSDLNPFVQWVVEIGILSLSLLSIAVIRPFQQWFKNVGMCVVLTAAICNSVGGFLSNFADYRRATEILTFTCIGIMGAYILAVLVLLVWYQLIGRLWKRDVNMDDMKAKMALEHMHGKHPSHGLDDSDNEDNIESFGGKVNRSSDEAELKKVFSLKKNSVARKKYAVQSSEVSAHSPVRSGSLVRVDSWVREDGAVPSSLSTSQRSSSQSRSTGSSEPRSEASIHDMGEAPSAVISITAAPVIEDIDTVPSEPQTRTAAFRFDLSNEDDDNSPFAAPRVLDLGPTVRRRNVLPAIEHSPTRALDASSTLGDDGRVRLLGAIEAPPSIED